MIPHKETKIPQAVWYSQKEKKDEKKKIKERGFKELYKWKVLQTEEGGERKILAKRDCFGQGYLPLGERWDLSNRFPH